MKAILSLIILGALAVSGLGQTRNVLVGTNNTVVQPTNFWSTDASNARTGLGLGTAATNPASAFQPSSTVLSNLASSNAANLTNLRSTNIIGSISIAQGGTGATNADVARTNLGLVFSGLTNTNADTIRTSINLGTNNNPRFAGLVVTNVPLSPNFVSITPNSVIASDGTNSTSFGFGGISFSDPLAAATTRTNLGLGWSALTNTNAGIGLVSVNTNGEVVSPTNFWQAAPITTTFIESEPVTNFTTNITPARFLHIHSLATNIANVTNTIVLPTNTLTFEGDVAIVVHKGPTNSMTRVQRAGSTNNLITLTRFDEAVQFVYYNDVWQFDHNVAFVEPIYFAGTNASANAAASRTNLGLGAADNVVFGQGTEANVGIGVGSTNTGLAGGGGTILGRLGLVENGNLVAVLDGDSSPFFGLYQPITFQGTNAASNAATTRTNLGLGATNMVTFAGLTNNGDITINQTTTTNGLLYIYRTNNEPFLGLANLIASNNTTVSNETLFRVGVSEATNRAAQFGFRSTNTNGNGVAVFSVFGYNALMMVGPSARSATNVAIEADIYSVSPTNRVATLIDTNTGAFALHRAIQFPTNESSVGATNLVPATNNQIQKWLRVYIGTNAYFLPLYQ